MGNTSNNTTSDQATSTKEDFEYFRSEKHALEVVIGDPDPTKGQIANPTVKFVPYFIEEKGREGKLRYGFLKTKNGSAIKKLLSDPNVERISKKDYQEATVEKFDDGKPPVQIGGIRAPY